MKLENQVVSLDLSKRLKELGVKSEHAFIWSKCNLNTDEDGKSKEWWGLFLSDAEDEVVPFNELPDWYDGWEYDWTIVVPAYTAAELGEMLPYSEDWMTPSRLKDSGIWVLVNGEKILGQADTEADARAKMLIYLLENNLI